MRYAIALIWSLYWFQRTIRVQKHLYCRNILFFILCPCFPMHTTQSHYCDDASNHVRGSTVSRSSLVGTIKGQSDHGNYFQRYCSYRIEMKSSSLPGPTHFYSRIYEEHGRTTMHGLLCHPLQ